MYDRDVQLIQFCAATLPPNTFILHCLNKFNLINWASKDFAVSEEESIRFLPESLIECTCLFVGLLFLTAMQLSKQRNCPFFDRMTVMSESNW